MARARKKKHNCAECGESFNHGIGLRKHQRQTGHKGSQIVEEGDDDSPAAAPAPVAVQEPVKAAPPPPAPIEPEPEFEPEPEPDPAAYATQQEEPDDDQTVAVQRHAESVSIPDHTVPVSRPVAPYRTHLPGPSKIKDTKQKLNLLKSGMKVVLTARAKDAGQQFKRSARSGADIFTEALKLAVALICFLAIPTVVFFWWKSHAPAAQAPPHQKEIFRVDGELAARSTLLRYLDHLGKKQWSEAYALLSPEWQEDLTPASFKDSFLDIEDVRWAVSDQRLNADGEADVLVRLAYREGGRDQRFVGRFRLNKGSEGWRIDRAELSADRTT